jgi:hypothetical protein
MGNSNLAKDKFLRKALERNEPTIPFNCVQSSLFLSFNKIKALVNEVVPKE